MKLWTEARNDKYIKYHSKLTYQLSFWNVSRKVDNHAGGKQGWLDIANLEFPNPLVNISAGKLRL